MMNLERNKMSQLDFLDLLISVLQEHEKRLDVLSGELHLAVQKFNDILDRIEKRNETTLKYYEDVKSNR